MTNEKRDDVVRLSPHWSVQHLTVRVTVKRPAKHGTMGETPTQ